MAPIFHGGTPSKELGIANMLNPSQETNPNFLFIKKDSNAQDKGSENQRVQCELYLL